MAPNVGGRPEGLAGGPRRRIEDLRFVVVGAYVADCFVNTPRLPAWGEIYQAESIRTSPGGKGLNMAVALARLGAQVTAVGVVGDDGLGRDVFAALVREGADVSGMQTREGVATAICVCFVGESGETAFVWRIADEMAATVDTVRAASVAIERADTVLVTFEIPVAAIRETLNAASRGGSRVLVQPAPPLADRGAAASLPWDQVDVLVPNEAEARALLDDRHVDRSTPADGLATAVAARLGVGTVVVTLGASGCVIHTAGVTRRCPAPVADAVDTTGASDAFTATFAAHISAGAFEAAAVREAQSAAIWAIRHPGGHESMRFS